MKHDVAREFYSEVIPSYTDYASKRLLYTTGDDLRLAMAAVNHVAHFRESLPEPYFNKDVIKELCPDWFILSETNDAYKHKVRNKRKNVLVASKLNIAAIDVITDYFDDKGPYQHRETEIDVFLVDGTYRDVFELLTNVVNFYFQILFSLDIIGERGFFNPKKTGHLTRAEANSAQPVRLPVSPWTPLIIEYRNQRFNYKTGRLELYDPGEFQITKQLFEYDKERNVRTYVWTPDGSEPPPQFSISITPDEE